MANSEKTVKMLTASERSQIVDKIVKAGFLDEPAQPGDELEIVLTINGNPQVVDKPTKND